MDLRSKLKNVIESAGDNLDYDGVDDLTNEIIKIFNKNKTSDKPKLNIGNVIKRYSITYNYHGSDEVLTEIAEGKNDDEALASLLKKHNYGIEWRTVSHPL